MVGPFTKAIPAKLEAMALLPGLSDTSPQAELAEKFHMSQSLLRALNPRAGFRKAGESIVVANVPETPLRPGSRAVEAIPPRDETGRVATTIVVDKPAGDVRAYGADGTSVTTGRRWAAPRSPRQAANSLLRASVGTQSIATIRDLHGKG